jgi:hypothetical protein
MNRSRDLDRSYRRLLTAGLGVSALIHVGLLAMKFTAPALPRPTSSVVFERVVPVVEEPIQQRTRVIQLIPAPATTSAAEAPILDAAPAAPSAASASATPVAVSETGSGAPVPAAARAEVAYEKMPVIDPLSMGEVSPVVFTDLPVAATDPNALEDGEADVPLYVPGSIGKAKRNWAGGIGSNEIGNGRGAFVVVGGGGGHCPMPGRGAAPPPVWK